MMKRIVLSVEAGTEPGNYGLTPEAVLLEFIYGTSANGLTTFEIFLDDLEVGELKELHLPGGEVESFFGCHLRQFTRGIKLLLQPETLYLRFKLHSCTEVEPREIVKAISQALAGGGCGGDCGCGCG